MTRPLHMLRMDVDAGALIRFVQAQGLNHGQDGDLGYATHAWLAACFGPLAPKPFRIQAPQGSRFRLLGYSEQDSETLVAGAVVTASNAAREVLDRSDLASSCLPQRWEKGRRYAFDVLVCPVSRRLQTEKDVFLRLLERLPEGKEAPTRSEVYQEWLTAQMLGAAEMQGFRLHAFQLIRLVRRTQSRRGQPRFAPPMTRPQALCRGGLVVTDPERFDSLLRRGIGRHRAFGYGMLLLGPE